MRSKYSRELGDQSELNVRLEAEISKLADKLKENYRELEFKTKEIEELKYDKSKFIQDKDFVSTECIRQTEENTSYKRLVDLDNLQGFGKSGFSKEKLTKMTIELERMDKIVSQNEKQDKKYLELLENLNKKKGKYKQKKNEIKEQKKSYDYVKSKKKSIKKDYNELKKDTSQDIEKLENEVKRMDEKHDKEYNKRLELEKELNRLQNFKHGYDKENALVNDARIELRTGLYKAVEKVASLTVENKKLKQKLYSSKVEVESHKTEIFHRDVANYMSG